MPLSKKHDSYRNKRALQDGVRAQKEIEAPAGLQWNGMFIFVSFTRIFKTQYYSLLLAGIVDRYDKDLKSLKPEDQYIWHLRMEGNIKVVVTAHPTLASLIHVARYIVCDYTFKRMNSDLNEWEVAIWHAATNERKHLDSSFLNTQLMYVPCMLGVTVARVYCNDATKEAFEYVWEGFFHAIKTATGKDIKFKVFDNSGNIQCVILDMEAAQVQGLGTAIIQMKMNDPLTSKITEVDPDILVQYLIKLCYVHWDR